MRRALVLLVALALAGCADVIRLAPAAGRAICAGLGCPCTARSSGGARVAVGFDVHSNGTVVPVYAEGASR